MSSASDNDLPASIHIALQKRLGVAPEAVQAVPSAQQRVWILQYAAPLPCWESPSQRIVVRQWRGGARWWNFHQARHVASVAAAEQQGYQLAHLALGHKIPQLLYQAADWAVLEYVGDAATHRFDRLIYNQSWTSGLIKVRHEFGFDEPHPRWGRVPVAQCIEYVRLVLDQVMVPLHRYLRTTSIDFNQRALCPELPDSQLQTGYTYQFMVQQYQTVLQTLQQQQQQQSNTYPRLSQSVQVLSQCIQQLSVDTQPSPLSPVLLHMDCQPQNLVFGQTPSNNEWTIAAVLDWEDCAWGDPRFELLLLGRKVCANRTQAQHVWSYYQECFPHVSLGPLEPWLRLETVHSLCTLLLQSMNLLDGGRSPWESKPDLQGKIAREFRRLVESGWSFCVPVAVEKPPMAGTS